MVTVFIYAPARKCGTARLGAIRQQIKRAASRQQVILITDTMSAAPEFQDGKKEKNAQRRFRQKEKEEEGDRKKRRT